MGRKGTQSTIPGSQDAEGREELAGDASASSPLHLGRKQDCLLPSRQRLQPLAEGVTAKNGPVNTQSHPPALEGCQSEPLSEIPDLGKLRSLLA